MPGPERARRLLAAAALALAAGSPARAADGPAAPPAPSPAAGPALEIPAGIPIALDGRIEVGEWQDGAVVPMPAGAPAVRVKHVRGTLLLAMRLGRRWEPPGRLVLYAVAAEADGTYDAPGAVVADFEPFDHNRPHAYVQRRIGPPSGARWVRADGRAVARFALLDVEGAMEAAVPMSLLGAAGKDAPPLRWFLAWMEPGRTATATFPAGLEIGAAREGLPADFATTSRWARTPRLAGADGPGAFSPTDWDALVAA